MKTTVKPNVPEQHMYGISQLENYPPELPTLVKEAQAKLFTCPFCGIGNTQIFYWFLPGEIPRYIFHAECFREGIYGCGGRSPDWLIDDDTIDDIEVVLYNVCAAWNRRPDDAQPKFPIYRAKE